MKKFAAIIILLSLIAPYMAIVKNVEAQSQPGWYLVKYYAFSGSLNTTEWGTWLSAQAISPSVTNDNKLNLSMPANPVTPEHCQYVAAVYTKEQFAPSMKIKMRANFQNALQRGVMIGFWMSQEGEIRNEVTVEYHGSWRVDGKYEFKPSIYYNVKTDQFTGYWTCWANHKHYYSGDAANLREGFAPFDFWNGWHIFEIDVGYADDQGINRYMTHYIDGVKVFDTGLVQYVPTVPMNVWLGINLPGWTNQNQIPNVRTYILIDYVEVYYWMDPLDNGDFNNGLTGWGYSNLNCADVDGDGDREVTTNSPSGYWFTQDIGVPHRNVYVDWKMWLKSSGTNIGATVNFFWRSKWDYNLTATLTYKGSKVWLISFAFESLTLGFRKEIVDSATINWDAQLNCRLYKYGNLFGFRIAEGESGPILYHKNLIVQELDRKCCSNIIASSGWDVKLILDDFTVKFDLKYLNYVQLKIEVIGAGQVFPVAKLYSIPKNAQLTLTAIPFNSSYVAVWHIDNTVKVGNNLTLIADHDYVLQVDFQPLSVWSYLVELGAVNEQVVHGYGISSMMGTTGPTVGTHNYTVNSQITLCAYPYSQYFFKEWKAIRHDNVTIHFNNETQITLNLTSESKPFWKKFVAQFSASEIRVSCNVPPTIYVFDNGIGYKVNCVKSASTYDFYLPKGTWNLLFYAAGYYSQNITLLVDRQTETLTVYLRSVIYGNGEGETFPCPRLIVGNVDFGFINIHASNDVVKTVKIDAATLSKVWNGSYVVLKIIEGSPEFSSSESDIDMVSLNGKAPVKALLKGRDVTAILACSDDIKLHLTLNDELELYFECPVLTEGEFKLEGVNVLKMCKIFMFETYFNYSGSFNLWNDTVKVQTINAPATLILHIHYTTLYPIIDIYARNISYINIDVVKLYNIIGGGYHYNIAVEEKMFNGLSVDTDNQLILDLILPMKPKEIWKDTGSQLVKLDNYVWTGNILTLTVSLGDPAYSIIYPSVMEQISQVSIDLVWQMLPFILAVAFMVAAFSIFRRFARM